MKTDAEIKQAVREELQWDARIDETKMGVSVKSGIVTLKGYVQTYAEKIATEKAAKKVLGVQAVVMDIDVKISGSDKQSDVDIAQIALNNLKWNAIIPRDTIKVKVDKGWITLDGKVDWNFQKTAAKKAVENLRGAKGVSNLIEVRSTLEPKLVKENIKKTFERNAVLDAEKINVSIEGHKVILTGTVRSWTEQKQAYDVAWSAPGVWQVENNLEVRTPELVRVVNN